MGSREPHMRSPEYNITDDQSTPLKFLRHAYLMFPFNFLTQVLMCVLFLEAFRLLERWWRSSG